MLIRTGRKMFSVSVITPVFNGAAYLSALVESVQSQDYPNLEHIVIDDGSTDGGATISILKKYAHLRWWSRENRGQYATMNEGLKAAKGEVICFISADDQMTPGAILKAVGFLAAHDRYAGVYGNYSFINSEGTKLSQFHPMRYLLTSLYPYSLHIAHSSLYLSRQFLVENKLYFDSTLKYVGDYDWLVRIIRTGCTMGRMHDDLSLIRLHDEQTSTLSFYKMRRETRDIQMKLGISVFWASAFRKVMFLVAVVNLLQRKGLAFTLQMISDRLIRLRDDESNPDQSPL